MSHNYILGLTVLIFAFVFFYSPLVYAFFKIRKQQHQPDALGTARPRPEVDKSI